MPRFSILAWKFDIVNLDASWQYGGNRHTDHRTFTLFTSRAPKVLSSVPTPASAQQSTMTYFRYHRNYLLLITDVHVLRNCNVRYSMNNILDDDMMRDWLEPRGYPKQTVSIRLTWQTWQPVTVSLGMRLLLITRHWWHVTFCRTCSAWIYHRSLQRVVFYLSSHQMYILWGLYPLGLQKTFRTIDDTISWPL